MSESVSLVDGHIDINRERVFPDYKIEVFMTPDEEMVMTPYFWCVLRITQSNWCNCGHGWAVSPKEAWEQAYEYYFNIATV